MADFNKYSNKPSDAPFTSVVFGANAPLLEVELNEMQQIIEERTRRLLKGTYGDFCVVDSKALELTSDWKLHINTDFIVNGVLIPTAGTTFDFTGSPVYLEVSEVTYSYNSPLKSNGNARDKSISNPIKDSRTPAETTRRKGFTFKFTNEKTPYYVGTLAYGAFQCQAPSCSDNLGMSQANKDYPFDLLLFQKWLKDNSISGYFALVSTAGTKIESGTYKVTTTKSSGVMIVCGDSAMYSNFRLYSMDNSLSASDFTGVTTELIKSSHTFYDAKVTQYMSESKNNISSSGNPPKVSITDSSGTTVLKSISEVPERIQKMLIFLVLSEGRTFAEVRELQELNS